jgi:hypothetical protein
VNPQVFRWETSLKLEVIHQVMTSWRTWLTVCPHPPLPTNLHRVGLACKGRHTVSRARPELMSWWTNYITMT